jgi:hypothetical protein
MAADKPVAKREGAFRIFAAPIFFFAIAMLLGGDISLKTSSPARRRRSLTRSSQARFYCDVHHTAG